MIQVLHASWGPLLKECLPKHHFLNNQWDCAINISACTLSFTHSPKRLPPICWVGYKPINQKSMGKHFLPGCARRPPTNEEHCELIVGAVWVHRAPKLKCPSHWNACPKPVVLLLGALNASQNACMLIINYMGKHASALSALQHWMLERGGTKGGNGLDLSGIQRPWMQIVNLETTKILGQIVKLGINK